MFYTFVHSGFCIDCGQYKKLGLAASGGKILCGTCFEIRNLKLKLQSTRARCRNCSTYAPCEACPGLDDTYLEIRLHKLEERVHEHDDLPF